MSVDTPVIPPPVILAGMRNAVQPKALRKSPNVMIRCERTVEAVICFFMISILISNLEAAGTK
jgi:hypothetical protein